MIDSKVRGIVQPLFEITASPFIRFGVHPIVITIAGFLVGTGSAVAVAIGYKITALALLWFSGLLDVLDGTIARKSKKTTKVGAFLDLIFDRVVESIIIIGFYFCVPQFALYYILFLSSVIFNFSTFLIAANLFENKGQKSMHYDVGLMERSETFIFFSLAMVLPEYSHYIFGAASLLIFTTGIIRSVKVVQFAKTLPKEQ
jgi:archaetidylinositol phosphate synthase